MSDQKKQPTKDECVRIISKMLADRRQRRNITHDQASQTLKIRSYYLECLEGGKWGELPGEVYVRGFLKRYAEFLGLDADELLAPYLQAVKESTHEEESTKPSSLSVDNTRMKLVWIGVGVILIIGMANFLRKESTSNEVVYSDPAPVQTPNEKEVEPVKEMKEAVSPKPVASAPLKSHRLEVFSPFPLWMRVQAENRTFEGFIPQDSTWTWKGEGQFSIRLGHTRQVSLYFDGAPVILREKQKTLSLPI